MITQSNFLAHELIGLRVEIVESRDLTLVGRKGYVVDESRNMFKILSENGKKISVFKGAAKFHFILPDGSSVYVDGSKLICRPEERVKRLYK